MIPNNWASIALAYKKQILKSEDCIIALGSRFDDRTTGSLKKYAPNAFKAYKENRGGIIHCNIEEKEINKNVDSHFKIELQDENRYLVLSK